MSTDIAYAISKSIRTSQRKLSLVVNLVRGMKVSDAIMQLSFCKKRIAIDVKKCLQSAIANAENNFGLDIDRLIIDIASTGKYMRMKRFRPRARGRSSKIKKDFSRLYISVKEE